MLVLYGNITKEYSAELSCVMKTEFMVICPEVKEIIRGSFRI